jgi:hypothetical protein
MAAVVALPLAVPLVLGLLLVDADAILELTFTAEDDATALPLALPLQLTTLPVAVAVVVSNRHVVLLSPSGLTW